MIANALTFITKQMNDYMKRQVPSHDTFIELSPVTSGSAQGKLFLSLVDIEEDALLGKKLPKRGNEFMVAAPPMSLNLDVLVSVSPQTPYVEGMKHLSDAMAFFQAFPYFDTSGTTMPNGIHKMTIEMIRTEAKNDLWLSLGADYQPSVMYKMRLSLMDSELIKAEIPAIKKPKKPTS